MDTRKLVQSETDIIDPTRLDAMQSRLLAAVLRDAITKKNPLLKAGVRHFLPASPSQTASQYRYFVPFGSPQQQSLMLRYKLFYRECSSDPTVHHFDVYSGKVLGGRQSKTGNFGDIEELLGTITLSADDQVTYKPKKELISKLQDYHPKLSSHEEEISKRVPYLHAKTMTVFKDGVGSKEQVAMVLDLLSGKDLNYLLEYDNQILQERKASLLSTDQRMGICMAAILSLMLIHDLKIVHSDVKPNNLVVELCVNGALAYFIDFGLSADTGWVDYNDRRGTPIFFAPEAFETQSPITQLSDIFSLGWVLALVMQADRNKSETMHQAQFFANHCVFSNLFHAITDLSPEHQRKISDCLHTMVTADPEGRGSLEQALAIFEQVDLERKLTRFHDDPLAQVALRSAYEHGAALRQSLRNLACHSQGGLLDNLDTLETLCLSTFQAFAGDGRFFDACIGRLGLSELRDVSSPATADQRVKTITNSYREHYHKLLAFSSLIGKRLSQPSCPAREALQQLQSHITKTLDLDKGTLTLDVAARVAKRYMHVCEAVDRKLSRFQRLHSQGKDFSIFVYDNYLVETNHCVLIDDYDQAMRIQPNIDQVVSVGKALTYRW